ncbi:2549_t:CDS:1, partial [Acaulospora colombiana]
VPLIRIPTSVPPVRVPTSVPPVRVPTSTLSAPPVRVPTSVPPVRVPTSTLSAPIRITSKILPISAPIHASVPTQLLTVTNSAPIKISSETPKPVDLQTSTKQPSIPDVISTTSGGISTSLRPSPNVIPTSKQPLTSALASIQIPPSITPSFVQSLTSANAQPPQTSNLDQTSIRDPSLASGRNGKSTTSSLDLSGAIVSKLPIGDDNAPEVPGNRKNGADNPFGANPHLPSPPNPPYISPYDSRSPYFIPAVAGTIIAIILIISIIIVIIKKTIFIAKGKYDDRDKRKSHSFFKQLSDVENAQCHVSPTTQTSGLYEESVMIESSNNNFESSVNGGSEIGTESTSTMDLSMATKTSSNWNECMK